jgi:DNA-binding MarR family transcriptional regulator
LDFLAATVATEATMAMVKGSDNDEGLWLNISELARLRGITKGPLSRRVKRLEEGGFIATKTGERGQKLVNIAEFDLAAERTVDAIRAHNGRKARKRSAPIADKTLAPERPRAPSTDDGEDDDFSPVLAKEQARRVAYQADLAKLQRDEKLGKLLPIENIAEAAAQCAEALNRVIDQLPARADEIAAAVAKEGVSGVRSFLRSVARDMRERLADEMQRLATMSGEATGP